MCIPCKVIVILYIGNPYIARNQEWILKGHLRFSLILGKITSHDLSIVLYYKYIMYHYVQLLFMYTYKKLLLLPSVSEIRVSDTKLANLHFGTNTHICVFFYTWKHRLLVTSTPLSTAPVSARSRGDPVDLWTRRAHQRVFAGWECAALWWHESRRDLLSPRGQASVEREAASTHGKHRLPKWRETHQDW